MLSVGIIDGIAKYPTIPNIAPSSPDTKGIKLLKAGNFLNANL